MVDLFFQVITLYHQNEQNEALESISGEDRISSDKYIRRRWRKKQKKMSNAKRAFPEFRINTNLSPIYI